MIFTFAGIPSGGLFSGAEGELTEKQRKRGATRTDQINFRCSPAFRAQVAELSKQLDISIADLMERALDPSGAELYYANAQVEAAYALAALAVAGVGVALLLRAQRRQRRSSTPPDAPGID